MDFLNRAIAQLTDLFKSMTPGARLTAGLLLVTIIVSMAFLVNHVGSDQDAYLMSGEAFSSPQLHNMEAAFAKANLNDYRIEGNRVLVRSGKQSVYMGALADAGACRQRSASTWRRSLDRKTFLPTRNFASRPRKSPLKMNCS